MTEWTQRPIVALIFKPYTGKTRTLDGVNILTFMFIALNQKRKRWTFETLQKHITN